MSKETLILAGTHVAAAIIGFLFSRLTMTCKERKDHQARLQDNSNKLSSELDKRYQGFTTAINKYVQKGGEPNLDDFYDIATTGDSYFSQCRMICDYILSGNMDEKSIKNTHLPVMKDVIDKSLPGYYGTLQKIAKKRNIPYGGILKRENYKSIYEVYNKYKLGENK